MAYSQSLPPEQRRPAGCRKRNVVWRAVCGSWIGPHYRVLIVQTSASDGNGFSATACHPDVWKIIWRFKRVVMTAKIHLLRLVAGFALPAALIAQTRLVPAPITLPKPGYEGTPPNATGIPNLEKFSGKERPPFLVPEGVTNVARGKKVTSSEKEPVVGELDMITDGDIEQIDGNNVELGRGVQWVQIDLEAPHEIYGIVLWHYHQPRVYFSVIVQTADDAAFTKSV